MTLNATIPAWNNAGVLPPVRPSSPGNSEDRSPYFVELTTLVDRFAMSPERIVIFDGLLRFRADIHRAGIVSGFQWLDGSFLEQVELLEGRPPRDMDVVSFVDLSGVDQRALVREHSTLFDHQQAKDCYSVDAYFFQVGGRLDADSIKRVAYWYSMWSHRRDGLWKGFVQIELDPAQDADARAVLNPHGGIHHE
ncbi:hypothetical protein AB4090_07350 [Acidithiobacillus sp. IBUN Pt1247-S3]|uniref:DUF6932 family protein n=1 Tax=Acidithiobacillus sp. IBUN Pt1247-S3 TaxID=3166642 RepID=UPI0034E3DF59